MCEYLPSKHRNFSWRTKERIYQFVVVRSVCEFTGCHGNIQWGFLTTQRETELCIIGRLDLSVTGSYPYN
jgi:hypothetical protein